MVTSGRHIKYLSVKNYGKTAGRILNIHFLGDLDERHNKHRLVSLKEVTLAPRQNITSEFSTEFEDTVHGEIRYISPLTQKIYTEDFKLNFSTKNFLWSKEQEKGEKPADNVPQAIYEATTQLIKTLK